MTLSATELSLLETDTHPINDSTRTSQKGRRRRRKPNEGLRRLGSRRMRRFANEMELRKSGALENRDYDIRELFMVRWRSGFSDIFGAGKGQWETFRGLSEEDQQEWLREGGHHGTNALERKKKKQALRSVGRVDGRLRNVLKRREFLVPVIENVEEQVRSLSPGGRVVFIFASSVQRLVAHGVAQFYDMRHHSEDSGRGERVTIIQDKDSRKRVMPENRLVDLLNVH